MTTTEQWTLERLHAALLSLDEVVSHDITLTWAQGSEPCIQLAMNEYGGLPIYVAVVGEQIIADTVLVDLASIREPDQFNEAILRSRELFPLSSIGLESMPDGEIVYNMFGALSADSSLANVVTEIFTLAENAQHAAEAFEGFFH